MSPQYGELRPTSGWDRFVSLWHPANCNGFRVLAALLHDTPVLGVSQTLRRWTEGATYIRQVGHHVVHWPTFLVRFLSKWSPLVASLHQWHRTSEWDSGCVESLRIYFLPVWMTLYQAVSLHHSPHMHDTWAIFIRSSYSPAGSKHISIKEIWRLHLCRAVVV